MLGICRYVKNMCCCNIQTWLCQWNEESICAKHNDKSLYDCHLSAGKEEGINKKIKVMKRNTYVTKGEKYVKIRLDMHFMTVASLKISDEQKIVCGSNPLTISQIILRQSELYPRKHWRSDPVGSRDLNRSTRREQKRTDLMDRQAIGFHRH